MTIGIVSLAASRARAPQSIWAQGPQTSLVNQSTSTIAVSIVPGVGDLMVVAWAQLRGTTASTSVAIADTGSGGWTNNIAFGSSGNSSRAMWWKVATSTDNNSGSGITITVTPSGGTGSFAQNLVCSDYTMPANELNVPYTIANDISYVTSVNSVATESLTGAGGTHSTTLTDSLAVAVTMQRGGTSLGGHTGTNTFTGTSAAVNLTNAIDNGAAIVGWASLVQVSGSVSVNTFKTTWTTSTNIFAMGASFYWTA